MAPTILPSSPLIALFFTGAANDISKRFLRSARFLLHDPSLGGIALLLLRGFPAAPVVTIWLLGLRLAPVVATGGAGFAAGYLEDGKLVAEVDGRVVESAVVAIF